MTNPTDEKLKSFNVDLWKHKGQAGALIPLLQSAQDTYGYVSQKAMDYISHVTGVPIAEIYGVVTFYAQFRTKPLGKYVIKICNGTACHVNGAKGIADTIIDELKINYDETSDDRNFSLLSVACIGCCSLAPVILINDETYGRLTPPKLRKIMRRYKRRAKEEASTDAEAKQ
ncbi:MAG: NADH-quinone oxidoreductase subunit NuoE [candidate division Zixibacteria bacterium]|nr:NADH-quinone oxidoreductase subunit NuoE [candidate division Zixibacteria bacterium]